MQVKKIIAVLLTVCLLFSLSVPAYAVDEVYNIADDVVPAPVIYYTEDYYPGLLAQLRSSMTFANNRIAHGSFATMNYNPSWVYKSGSTYPTGDFNSLTPFVTADQTDISGVYSIPRTTLLSGNMLIFYLPSTSDAYFDFQSSNIAFDQQDANANTFYINGTLTFNLRNLWNFSGQNETTSFYLASDPLAVQLLIDGKAYGDIIDVTGYTSPFSSLYGNAVPSNASVTFDNLKVYYQGDTPDMVGFRVYTGSAFTDGQYNYNSAGDFVGVDVTNTVTMRFNDLPDITFVNEGGNGYSGDLSGISGLLSTISSSISSLLNQFSFRDVYSLSDTGTINGTGGVKYFTTIVKDGFLGLRSLLVGSAVWSLGENGALDGTGAQKSLFTVVRTGFLGLRSLMVDSSGQSWLRGIYANLVSLPDYFTIDPSFWYWASKGLHQYTSTTDIAGLVYSGFMGLHLYGDQSLLNPDGSVGSGSSYIHFPTVVKDSLLGLANLSRNAQSYVADTVFSWQSYNMQTHQLNTATNITGQNNLFFTAFQSMEDKLGRLAYVFGSDEDLALKDSADPSTDAFRENFGGGASLKDIGDAAELTTSVPQLMDSGFDFGDGLEEIATNDSFLAWFSAETWAALDSTGNVAAADDDYLADYFDNLRRVEEKRHWGD